MKKVAMFAIIAAMFGANANAGLLDSLGITKKAEPQSLAEACDTDEIKKLCPEVILGDMTITECIKNNISSLSSQCANYVKKSISNGGEELKAKLAEGGDGLKAKLADGKAESDAATAERTAQIEEAKAAAAQTVEDAKRTGGLLKSLF